MMMDYTRVRTPNYIEPIGIYIIDTAGAAAAGVVIYSFGWTPAPSINVLDPGLAIPHHKTQMTNCKCTDYHIIPLLHYLRQSLLLMITNHSTFITHDILITAASINVYTATWL